MHKITQNTINVFMSNEESDFKENNTLVENWLNCKVLVLHGNEIAKREKATGLIMVSHAGWPTVTTKERLNGIPGVSIQQKMGKWYLNGIEWGGEWVLINGVV